MASSRTIEGTSVRDRGTSHITNPWFSCSKIIRVQGIFSEIREILLEVDKKSHPLNICNAKTKDTNQKCRRASMRFEATYNVYAGQQTLWMHARNRLSILRGLVKTRPHGRFSPRLLPVSDHRRRPPKMSIGTDDNQRGLPGPDAILWHGKALGIGTWNDARIFVSPVHATVRLEWFCFGIFFSPLTSVLGSRLAWGIFEDSGFVHFCY